MKKTSIADIPMGFDPFFPDKKHVEHEKRVNKLERELESCQRTALDKSSLTSEEKEEAEKNLRSVLYHKRRRNADHIKNIYYRERVSTLHTDISLLNRQIESLEKKLLNYE